jgi:hypothetical protein
VDRAERQESTNWLRARDNPLLLARKGDGVHKVVTGDIFFEGTPVRIMCVAIGVVIEDVQETESEGCRLTQRTIGFAGNRKIGGTSTRRKNDKIHGVNVFVIDDFAALGLVLSEQWRAATAFNFSSAAARCASIDRGQPDLPAQHAQKRLQILHG